MKINYTDQILRISLNIRRVRIEKKLTIQEVAYRCNIERSNLSRIEAGKSNLTIKSICQICNALEVSFEDIVVGQTTEDLSDNLVVAKKSQEK
ncbi:MAG: helix-turn-helix transcriptional regulator [Rikenellaceae bacterium]